MNLSLRRLDIVGFETVYRIEDRDAGLDGVIAVHSTALGPALGGVRAFDYTPDQALRAACELAECMTLKNALAGVPCGGGKAVLSVGDKTQPGMPLREKMLESFALALEWVNSAGTRYIAGEDAGMSLEDIATVGKTSPDYVASTRGSGNPSVPTALGVRLSIEAACEHVYGTRSLARRTVAVYGAGSVGQELVRELREADAGVFIVDKDPRRACAVSNRYAAVHASPFGSGEASLDFAQYDVLAPCAVEYTVSERVARTTPARVICGSENIPLEDPALADVLHRRGVVYVPSFVSSAGGAVNGSQELDPRGYDSRRALAAVGKIYDCTRSILEESVARGVSPFQAARERAMSIVDAAR